MPRRQNRLGPGIAIGDLRGDRSEAVVIGGSTGSPARVLVVSGEAKFTLLDGALPPTAATLPDAAPLVFDADGDGRLDLFLPKGGVAAPAGDAAYQPRLYFNRGGGRFEPAPATTLPPLPVSAGPAVAADFNRDGRLDLFIGGRVVPGAYPETPRSVLLVNRGGTFADVTDEIAPGLAHVGLVSAALWTDVDGDGWPDLLLALQWGGVRCWRNLAGRRFEDWSERWGFTSAGSGWWNSLAAADFNGDGRLDYAVGNCGLNTQYRASPAEPALLYRGVFDASDRAQLLEAEYDAGRIVPVRGRSTLEFVLPSLLRKFPTFRAYAAATLEDLVSPDRLQAAERFAATELRSGVLLSQPDGTYRFEPLPRPAQIAPIFGLVAGDFDGDGRADLYAVQNSYAPIPEVGRFDGGVSQLLHGDGHGQFTPVPPAVSGLVVPGDAKALAVLDLDGDGWPDFLVTRNNERMLAFANTGVAGRQSLRVVLRGPAGNPTAIGARITVVLTDGLQQTAEVAAGSGYLSQSTAACFFGFPDSNPPRVIRVRWPSGRTTEIAGPAKSGTVAITAPSS